jgi:hypothetical protein
MALVIDLRITEGLVTRSLGLVEIRRQEPLENREDAYDETHRYVGRRVNRADVPAVEVEHRYGDGAWKLAEKVLIAMDINSEMKSGELVS